MSDSLPTGIWTRRAMLLLIGTSMIPGVALATISQQSVPIGYFDHLRRVTELELLSLRMRSILRQKSINSISELQEWSKSSALWIRSVIGDQWETLEHTIPTLVQDDLLARRTREIMGLHFTATELAMLLTDD